MLLLKVFNGISEVATPSIRIVPISLPVLNIADINEDFPAPVRPITPT